MSPDSIEDMCPSPAELGAEIDSRNRRTARLNGVRFATTRSTAGRSGRSFGAFWWKASRPERLARVVDSGPGGSASGSSRLRARPPAELRRALDDFPAPAPEMSVERLLAELAQ